MQAEIITIGDEILIGQIVDTNSAWIAQRLNEIGVTVENKISIGDDASRISATIDDALQRCDLVLVTGGLGPTKDDITKNTLAAYFGCELVRHEPSFDLTRRMLEQRGVPFNALNQAQSMVPSCCDPLLNHNGTAPGMWFERDGKILVSMPGVPYEMQAMMTEQVLPRVRKHFALQDIVHRTAVVFGLAESALALEIEPWENALPKYLKLAYLPNPSMIRLRLSAYDVDRAEAEREIDRQFALLEKRIPAYLVGYGETTLASAVATLLRGAGKTLAVAESCTGGAVCAAFTAMPGASEYFLGGVTAYSNKAKIHILGVDRAAIERHGAVSRDVAQQMAEGVRRITGADYAVATTGVAGPDGGTAEKPVGTIWFGVATPDGMWAKKMVLGHTRTQNIERGTAHAVNLLRLALTGGTDTTLHQGLL